MALGGLDPDVISALKAPAPKVHSLPKRVRMPLAERAADAQLSRCRLLVEAVNFASKALAHAGGRLQHGAAGFRPAEGGDALMIDACQSLVGACGGLGASLTQLGGILAGEVLGSLQDVQHAIEEDRDKRRPGLLALEQKEDSYKKLVEGDMQRKGKATEQLKTVMFERDEVERRGGWLLRKTLGTKLSRQIDQAAMVQDKVVQDLSQHVDELSAASLRRTELAETYPEVIIEADRRLRKALHPVLLGCVQAWQDTAQAITCSARSLQDKAAALAREIAGDKSTVAERLALDQDGQASVKDVDVQEFCAQTPALASATAAATVGRAGVLAEPAVKPSMLDPPAKTIGRPLDPRFSQEAHKAENERLEQAPSELARASPAIGEKRHADTHSDDSASEASSDYSSPAGSSADEDAYKEPAAESFTQQRVRETIELPSAESLQHLEFVAGSSQGPLGLKLSWPPGPVIMQAVVPGGWAATCGLQVGVEILRVNGQVVSTMQEAQLRDLLKERPLCISTPLPAATSAEASPAVTGKDRV